ncbi:MAG TPA: hypothetical protein VF128_02000 [Gemmatimonadaceae bacterium]
MKHLSAAVALAVVSVAPASGQQSCRAVGQLTTVADVPEASGVATSRKTPGQLWLHNDSGQPALFAVAADGAPRGRVRVYGAGVRDWEDIDVGPCPQGSCIYIGDIGDNNAKRRDVVIYRVAEPDAGAGTSAPSESMRLTYPDGPTDAEAFFVLPNGNLFIVTKGERGPAVLYRVPEFRDATTAQLVRVATVVDGEGRTNAAVARSNRITGASASRDGRWVALRSLHAVMFYAADDFTAGNVREMLHFDVSVFREIQGEGVAFGEDGTVWLSSEGGGSGRQGTIARLDCTLK